MLVRIIFTVFFLFFICSLMLLSFLILYGKFLKLIYDSGLVRTLCSSVGSSHKEAPRGHWRQINQSKGLYGMALVLLHFDC